MRAVTLLSLASTITALPTPSRRQLLDLSPVISPIIDLGGDNGCLGIGISVCDPINVDGEQNNSNSQDSTPEKEEDEEPEDTTVSLINISPEIIPEISIGGDNDCLGVGISVCNPINVDGEQNNSNSDESPEEEEEEDEEVDNSVSLIDISPEISPDLSIGGDNGCLGIGISVCDPINVGGSQGNS